MSSISYNARHQNPHLPFGDQGTAPWYGKDILSVKQFPSLDVSSAIEILDPYAQPRFPKSSCVEIGKYIAETCWGVKDHRILDQNELKQQLAAGTFDESKHTYWPYTYHQRLFAYPASHGRTVNQVEHMLARLAEDPITRRATAITFVPEIDQYIKGDLPCLQRIALRCREDTQGQMHLHMHTHWRSRDLFNAAADNIIAMTFWQREWAENRWSTAQRPEEMW